jgi:hypothetical protein
VIRPPASTSAGIALLVIGLASTATAAIDFPFRSPGVQAGAAAPQRIGPTSDQLSDADVASIAALFDRGEKLWLLVGHSQGFIQGWFVDAFLPPDLSTPALRRGPMETVTAPAPLDVATLQHGLWSKVASARYAQVLAAGNDPDRLTSSRDITRPFRVVGTLSDEEIVSLVTFLRSSPKGPDRPQTAATGRGRSESQTFATVQGSWPLVTIAKQEAVIRVLTLDSDPRERTGQSISLRRDGETWIIQSLGMYVVD